MFNGALKIRFFLLILVGDFQKPSLLGLINTSSHNLLFFKFRNFKFDLEHTFVNN